MPLTVLAYVGIPLALLLHGVTLWWSAKFPNISDNDHNLKDSSNENNIRVRLKYPRTLRLGLFLSSFVYLVIITSVTTFFRSGPAVKTRALGLLACYLYVAAKFWITALTFVPYFSEINLKYNTQITECMWVLLSLGGYSAMAAGLSGAGTFHCSATSWALISVLMSAPVEIVVPVQLVEMVMYSMLHLVFHKLSPAHCASLLIQYGLLGIALPATCAHFLKQAPTHIQVPYPLHLGSSLALSIFHLLHLILSSTSIAHAIQDSTGSSALSTLLSRFLQPPLGTARYGYGFSSAITIPVLLGLFMVVVLIRGAMAFEASQAWPAWRDSCMKHPLLSVLLQLVLSLPRWKKLVLAGLAGITVIQALAMKGMVLVLLLEGSQLLPDDVGDSTFIFLPSILIALLLQFVAVGLLLMPSEQQPQSSSTTPKSADAPSTSLSTAPSSAAAAVVPPVPVTQDTGSLSPAAAPSSSRLPDKEKDDSGLRSTLSHMNSQTLTSLDTLGERGLVPVLRDVALAAAQPTAGQVVLPSTMDKPTVISHLQEFTRGLHELQPQQQGARQFVGMANASVQALFPGVKYASMSVLSLESAQEVYITVLLGAGMNQPKMAVKVVPCTLLVYVLDSGQAVFISNTDTFVGPFSDVQFMRMAVGLRAVACLPLLWRDGDAMQVYGAVLMGFPEPRTWTDEDKKYAKQLAMILAEGIPLLDAEEPVQPYSPNAKINNALANSPGESRLVSSPSGASFASDAAHYPRSPARSATEGHTGSGLNANGVRTSSVPKTSSLSNVSQSQDGDLKMLEIIGRGGFGSVYKGIYHGQEVAVKVLEHGEDFMGCADDPLGNSHGSGGGDDAAAALSEGRMTLNIRHANVVQTFDLKVVDLTGSGDSNNGPRGSLQQTRIIMEFCDRGCLQDAVDRGHLHSGLPSEGGVPDLEAIVLTLAEVASALAHLHSHNITHRDLKPKNILLKSANKDRRGFTTKVSDFGLSQVLKDNEGTFISSKYGGTITHMPPELLEEGRVYPMGDVYAFGIIMWEVYTGATPYANMVRPQIMVGVVTHNLRPKFPESCPEWYRSLAYRCWRKDPKQRPSFANVTAQLQNILYERLWEQKGS